MYFCPFKQIQSWVEELCWWYVWRCGLALTPGGYNGAAENVLSVDGGAACSSRKECGDRGTCVLTSIPVTFFLSFPPPPLLSSPPFFTPFSPNTLLPVYLHSSVTNNSWRLICWLSKVLLVPAWRWSVQEERVQPPFPTALPVFIISPMSAPYTLTHTSHECRHSSLLRCLSGNWYSVS